MRRFVLLLPIVLLAACGGVPRETVELAGQMRRTPAGSADLAIADRSFSCEVKDRACNTLWLYRGVACVRLAEAPGTPDAARVGRRDCAVTSLTRARDLLADDSTAEERQETAAWLAEAHERRRDRASGAARQAENAAILDAIAPLRGTAAAGHAEHYAAGVALNRVQAGDIAQPARCAALTEARAQAARAAEGTGLPPLADRIAQRRAAIATQITAEGCA
jgi:hypothetical protein